MATPPAFVRIGIISDTHGLLRPEALRQLAGVHHIIHAGDIGRPEVISELATVAPVTAIKGNIDTGDWAAGYPATTRVTLGGRTIFVLHNLKELDLDPATAGIDVVVSVIRIGRRSRPSMACSTSIPAALARAVSPCPLRLRRWSSAAGPRGRAFMKWQGTLPRNSRRASTAGTPAARAS